MLDFAIKIVNFRFEKLWIDGHILDFFNVHPTNNHITIIFQIQTPRRVKHNSFSRWQKTIYYNMAILKRIFIRNLASKYFEIANSDENLRNMMAHKKMNDLQGERPIVLIDEMPWHELNIDHELDLNCADPDFREVEWFFKSQLYKWKHIRCDMVVRPYYAVKKVIRTTGVGLQRLENENESHALAHTFVNQIQTEEDIEKLHNEQITYDEKATLAQYEKIADLLGDILPVKICGCAKGYGMGLKTMDDIVNFRGLDTFFYDLIEKPEFMHKLIGKLTDIFIDKVRQFNELGLFDTDAYYIHGTSALTNDLKPDHEHPNSKGVWGRGLAQIFGSVGPDTQDEFDTQYMIKGLSSFGLVYYGCCEPLDNKIHILKKIPNLRKISITPWADVDKATEIMGKDYVVAAKANPASVGVSTLDQENLRAEIRKIVSACRRNGCSADLVLKDITTVCNRPDNLFTWAEIAMEEVEKY